MYTFVTSDIYSISVISEISLESFNQLLKNQSQSKVLNVFCVQSDAVPHCGHCVCFSVRVYVRVHMHHKFFLLHWTTVMKWRWVKVLTQRVTRPLCRCNNGATKQEKVRASLRNRERKSKEMLGVCVWGSKKWKKREKNDWIKSKRKWMVTDCRTTGRK